jgi:hypothetical protein
VAHERHCSAKLQHTVAIAFAGSQRKIIGDGINPELLQASGPDLQSICSGLTMVLNTCAGPTMLLSLTLKLKGNDGQTKHIYIYIEAFTLISVMSQLAD